MKVLGIQGGTLPVFDIHTEYDHDDDMIEMDLPEGLVEEYIAVRDCLDAVHGKLYFPVFDGFERKDWPG